MYSHDTRQFNFSEFLLPFDGKHEAKNRWVQLSAMVPWQRFEKQYAALFSADRGSHGKPFCMAFGALILKERLNCTDDELVE
jgi:transposase, IS5 family